LKTIRLGDVADVRISGVDKKTLPNEIPVRLCNYTDVYYNWAIREGKSQTFMLASAKQDEITRFRLHAGQVAITKDSETREDIGHATFIANDFDDVILGYHCALITPHAGKLDGQYLNALFRMHYVSDYLSRNAGGSGQRYYLSESAIRSIPLFLPPINAQLRIAGVLGSIDEKIELNRKKIAELEALAKTIYDYWFVQFDFPDKNGKPYKSSGGKMVWNDQLKREVPEGWEVGTVGDYVEIHRGASPRPIQDFLSSTGLRWLKISDATNATSPFVFHIEDHILKEGLKNTVFLRAGDLVLSNSASPGIPKFLGVDSCIHDGWLYFPRSRLSKVFLYLFFEKYREALVPQGNGSVFKNLKTDILRIFPMIKSTDYVLKRFNAVAEPVFDRIKTTAESTIVLSKHRESLLPLLMNGQVVVRGNK